MSADIEKVGPQDGLAVQQALQHRSSDEGGSESSPEKAPDDDLKKGDGKSQKEKDKEKGVGGFGAYLVRTLSGQRVLAIC